MITSSGKQSDKEVETSFVYLMQMYTFVIEVLQKSKCHYLVPPSHTSRWPKAQAFASFFSSSVQLLLWSGKENVILTRGPFDQSLSKITAVGGNVDQSKRFHILVHKLIYVFYTYWLTIFTAKGIRNAKEGTQYLVLGDTYQVQMSGAHTK